jgi:undecaprenyl-diphosphatase
MITDTLGSLRDLLRGRRPAEIWAEDHGTRLTALLFIGSVPTAIIGLTIKSAVEKAFSSGLLTSGALLVTGLLLITTWRRAGDRDEPEADAGLIAPTNITWPMALVAGVAQGLAIFPGISRSGATLVATLLLGAGRADAARFCFLLSVPAILGALILEAKALAELGRVGAAPLAAGVLAAVVAGYLSLALLVALVKRGGLHRFAFYVIPVGIAGLIYFSR